MKLQKIGGVSAFIVAATFIFGFVVYVSLLITGGYEDPDVDVLQKVAFLADHQAMMYLFNFIIYVVFGIFLVVLALALYERLKVGSPGFAQVATTFGLIWTVLVIASGMVANVGAGVVIDLYGQNPDLAASVWLTLNTVVKGLGGGNEIVGGIWVLLISLAVWRAGGFPRAFAYFGVVVSAAGILTTIPTIPGFAALGAIFGLGTIVWFILLGFLMLRKDGAIRD